LIWVLSRDMVKTKLETLGNLSGKKVGWIRSDLTIKKSNWLSRLIWTVVAKHFSWMRKYYYCVDLNQSHSILVQIGNQLPKKDSYQTIFQKAVKKFNQVAPKHRIISAEFGKMGRTSDWTEELGPKYTKKDVFAFLKEHGKKLTELFFSPYHGGWQGSIKCFEKITDSELDKILEYCPNLKKLWIRHNELGDNPLSVISSKLRHLENLAILSSDEVKDRDLEYLNGMCSLKHLNLHGCDKITKEGLLQLKEKLPELKIFGLEPYGFFEIKALKAKK